MPFSLPDHCFIIAEAGVNHNGSLDIACQLVDAAAEAGADAVKFQTFRAEKLATASAPKAAYQQDNTDPQESQLEMLRGLELSESDHVALIARAKARGILFLSTPFDEESSDLLERLSVPAFKLPSGEVTNLPLIAHIAAKRLPIFLSTGMATLDEVREAVECIRANDSPELVLLQCVSNYPAAPEDVNLRAMATMGAEFSCPVGYSDHTLGNAVTFAAVGLGARVIEKHFTLSRSMPGPDHQASLEPRELCELVAGIRAVEAALGDGIKKPAPSEANTAAVARKSVIALRSLAPGQAIIGEDLAIMRPGTGLPPKLRDWAIGKTLKVAVAAGTPLTEDMFTP